MDVDSHVALALRALQKLDEVETLTHRHLLLEAQTHLGRELGLDCTGVEEGDGFYQHNDSTCLIHEWLVEEDQKVAH